MIMRITQVIEHQKNRQIHPRKGLIGSFECYDPSDLRSLILTLDDFSVPRLINPRNHRVFAGAAGCPGRLPQAEATSGEANNQKDLIETGSLSVWNTFDGSLK